MRGPTLAACAATVLALASASAAWGQEESPTAIDGWQDSAVLTGAASFESSSAAAITEPCPSVIVRNTTLNQDCVGPITFGADGVQLNLAGHTVTCNGDPSAIGIAVVDRTRDRILNGRVVDCGTGILLLRGGEHRVTNVALTDHDQSATAARPPTGTVNHGTGLEVHRSNANDVAGVEAARNRIGVAALGADGNRFTSLEVTEGRPPFSGMEIQSASYNTVVASRFDSAGFAGLLISGGTGNVVRASRATGSARDGFAVAFRPTFDTLIESSEAEGNGRMGILLGVGTYRTTVKSNRAAANAFRGILVANGSTNNALTNNTASANGGFDLDDRNPACDNNIWLHNQFVTANQPCIQ